METVDGFDIPLRKLTDEESNMDLSLDRIRSFHYDVGEDFLDQNSGGKAQGMIFGGWLLHKYPQHSEEILTYINENLKYMDIHGWSDLEFLSSYSTANDIDQIYIELVEFVNQTTHLKQRFNQVLIQVAEYYKD